MNKLIAYIIFILIVVFALSQISCSPARQMEKAEQRVLANRESVEKVGREWSKLHPCVPDSIVKFLPGRVDTNTVVKSDTVVKKDTVYITKTVTKTKSTVDTFKITVRDNREIDLLKGDLEKEKAKNTSLQIKAAELGAEVEKQKGRKDKWFWLWVVTVTIATGWTFRKQILSLVTKIPL